jgi:hypothetical protein
MQEIRLTKTPMRVPAKEKKPLQAYSKNPIQQAKN